MMLLPIIFSLCMMMPVSDRGCPATFAQPLGTFPYCDPHELMDTSDYYDVRCLNLIIEV